MPLQLYRLGRACFRARGRVLTAWLLLLALVGAGLGLLGATLDESFSIPGTPAQVALEDLERTFPESAAGAAQVVVHSEDGEVTGGVVRDETEAALVEIAGMDGVAAVTDPYTGEPVQANGPGEQAPPEPPSGVESERVSADGSTAYAQVQFDDDAQSVPDVLTDEIAEALGSVEAQAGVSVSFGGEVFRATGAHVSIVEVVGVLVALVVLAITFRSVVAALVPIGTAIVGVGVAAGAVLLAANVITVSSSAPTLAMMIGLAVGIDYALFVVSRYRELLDEGEPPEEAAGRATATAGSAVVFAGATVVIALAGLSVAQIPFLTVMGLGAALAVVVAVVVALTLLPATLGFAGERLRPGSGRGPQGPISVRWSRLLTRRRFLASGAVIVFLGLLALPSQDLRLALPDNGTQEAGSTQRVAYDTIAEEFGPGYNGPLTVSVDILGSNDPLQTVDDLASDLAAVDGVEAVTTATPNEDADTAVFSVVPEGSPDAPETADLVDDLRAQSDERESWAELDLAVTGPTAVGLDTSEQLADALLPFGAVVVGLSLVLLTVVFRSLLVPLTASVGFLLSTAAAFGAVALVFEHGWLAPAIGVDDTGPVISFLPIMLMGVLFGLAMDYQVFLVTRMREHYVAGSTATAAVHAGIRQSSTVVVAAAAIMVAVFAAFVPTGDATLQPIAFALAIGVALDAFLVRLTLIPASMTILRDRAWWLPAWLDERLPELDIEGASLDQGRPGPAEPGPSLPGDSLVSARDVVLSVDRVRHPVDDFDVWRGGIVVVRGRPTATRELLWTLAGRGGSTVGTLRVRGRDPARSRSRPVVGVGGIEGRPARDRTSSAMASAEPRFEAAYARLLDYADLTEDLDDDDHAEAPTRELVANLAWAVAGDPPVVVAELPALTARRADTVWPLLELIALEGRAVVVSTPTAPMGVPPVRVRPEPEPDELSQDALDSTPDDPEDPEDPDERAELVMTLHDIPTTEVTR